MFIIFILFIINNVFIIFTKPTNINGPKVRSARATIFTIYGLFVLIPIIHFANSKGIKNLDFLKYIILELITLVGGAIIFATRIPECYYPGKFDLIGHSHQIFHIMVVIGNIFHYISITKINN